MKETLFKQFKREKTRKQRLADQLAEKQYLDEKRHEHSAAAKYRK